jgi:hypothetical protein
VKFELISEIENIETIAVGSSIHDLEHLQKKYGKGHWRKLKGIALVRFLNSNIQRVELHWYECHGFGRKEIKIKNYLD